MEAEEAESEDIHDAVGELANQVGGLIKGRLAPKSLLGLPTITEGTDFLIDVPSLHTRWAQPQWIVRAQRLGSKSGS